MSEMSCIIGTNLDLDSPLIDDLYWYLCLCNDHYSVYNYIDYTRSACDASCLHHVHTVYVIYIYPCYEGAALTSHQPTYRFKDTYYYLKGPKRPCSKFHL